MTETPESIIVEAKNGDCNAFKKIVHDHQSYAYALAFRFLCDEADAEDVVQEAFVRIWRHLKDFDTKRKFTTWMYRIVINLCYDKADSNKRRKRVHTSLDDGIHTEESTGDMTWEADYTSKEIAEFIKRIADGLAEKQRMIFLLRDMQDLSIREVSDITGLSEASVKTNLFYARTNIRRKLIKLGIEA
jgi:RNA polymerase sigma-70 factor, ECF subfamily